MIPMPPSHWLSWRQMRIERSSASTSVDDRRARRGEAGHPLEERVHRMRRAAARREDVRQPGEERRPAARSARRPGSPRGTRSARASAAQAREREPAAAGDRARGEERPERLAVPDRDRRGTSDERLRYASSVPVRPSAPATSIADPRAPSDAGARGRGSQHSLDVRHARPLGEHDHAVARPGGPRRCAGTAPCRRARSRRSARRGSACRGTAGRRTRSSAGS